MHIGTYITTVVDEAGQVPTLGGVYDGVLVNPEQVAAPDTLVLIALLPHVCHDLRSTKHRVGHVPLK